MPCTIRHLSGKAGSADCPVLCICLCSVDECILHNLSQTIKPRFQFGHIFSISTRFRPDFRFSLYALPKIHHIFHNFPCFASFSGVKNRRESSALRRQSFPADLYFFVLGKDAAAADCPTRRKRSSGRAIRILSMISGYSSSRTCLHCCTIRSPPSPDMTRPSSNTYL